MWVAYSACHDEGNAPVFQHRRNRRDQLITKIDIKDRDCRKFFFEDLQGAVDTWSRSQNDPTMILKHMG